MGTNWRHSPLHCLPDVASKKRFPSLNLIPEVKKTTNDNLTQKLKNPEMLLLVWRHGQILYHYRISKSLSKDLSSVLKSVDKTKRRCPFLSIIYLKAQIVFPPSWRCNTLLHRVRWSIISIAMTGLHHVQRKQSSIHRHACTHTHLHSAHTSSKLCAGRWRTVVKNHPLTS